MRLAPRVTRSGETCPAAGDARRAREKAHTREGDAIAAARRRLPMVEVDGGIPVVGAEGPVPLRDVFEGRTQLIAYYFMWRTGAPAPAQCEGCTFYTAPVRARSPRPAPRGTNAPVCQGPYEESARYRDFMGWEMPWYSVLGGADLLLPGRRTDMMHLVCYLRQGERVFETWATTIRGVEAMDNNYRLLDLTVYGRQEDWQDSPLGWPQPFTLDGGTQVRSNGRPNAQWSRLAAGFSDDLRRGPVGDE